MCEYRSVVMYKSLHYFNNSQKFFTYRKLRHFVKVQTFSGGMSKNFFEGELPLAWSGVSLSRSSLLSPPSRTRGTSVESGPLVGTFSDICST